MYPYFTFDDEEAAIEYIFEKENFPDEELWEKACKNCAPWSLNDFNVAASIYEELVKNRDFNSDIDLDNFEGFDF